MTLVPWPPRGSSDPIDYGLLTMLDSHRSDWPEGVPLAGPYGMCAMFEPPPRDRWPKVRSVLSAATVLARAVAIRTDSATFNVVEMDWSGRVTS